MAFNWNTSTTPPTGTHAMFNFKALLIVAGWTVTQSSDGTTYNSSGDQVTTPNTGANGLQNSHAWFVIQMPSKQSVTRQLCIQRGLDNQSWYIKYSRAGTFTSGSPTATKVPSSSDEQILLGTGPDSGPTFAQLYDLDGTYRNHLMAADSADEYQFYSATYPVGGGQLTHLMLLDCLVAATFPAGDIEPYVFTVASNSFGDPNIANASASNLNTDLAAKALFDSSDARSPKTWIRKGLVGEGFVGVSIVAYFGYFGAGGGNAQQLARNMPTNAVSGDDEGLPCFYARGKLQVAPNGFKGGSRLVRWAMTLRVTGDTLTVLTPRDRIIFDAISLPFDGTVPVI